MKKIILFSLLVLISCSKKLSPKTNEQVDTTLLEKINLDDYVFYKREVYVDTTKTNFYKGYDSSKGPIRYEIQFIAIEKTANSDGFRNFIQFSYIPPYIPNYLKKKNAKYIYDMNHFSDQNLININFINYFQFGKLLNNQVTLFREKSTSVWKISETSNEISIDELTFLDRGKMKTVKPIYYLNNKPLYKKMSTPKILFHYREWEDVNEQNTDFLKDTILYYNSKTNEIYFNFKKKLNDGQNDTWIMFDASRVKARYIK